MDVGGRQLEFHHLAHQPYAVSIRLQEADVRVAGDRKLRLRKLVRQRLHLECRNPWSRDDHVRRRCGCKALAEIRCADNRPYIRLDGLAAEDFGGVDGGYAQTDVADVAVGRKVLVSKDDAHSWGSPGVIKLLCGRSQDSREPCAASRKIRCK